MDLLKCAVCVRSVAFFAGFHDEITNKKKTRTQRVYKLLKNKSINKKQLIIDEEQERVGHHILIELVQQVVCSDHKALPGFVEFSPYQV